MRFGNLSATAMMMASVLSSVGCDGVESPFAPEFGVEEAPRLSVSAEPPSTEEPPAAAIDVPPPSDSEAADPSASPVAEQPGVDEPVMLREPTSIDIQCSSAAPLIIIDGVMQPDDFRLLDIQRMDIDHVEIVKGPAAVILFGPRAENGAIDIQTKRATQGTILNGLKPR